MSLSVLRDIVKSIKNANFHSTMVDKTSDVSDKEQHGEKFLPQKKNIILSERNGDYLGCSVIFQFQKL